MAHKIPPPPSLLWLANPWCPLLRLFAVSNRVRDTVKPLKQEQYPKMRAKNRLISFHFILRRYSIFNKTWNSQILNFRASSVNENSIRPPKNPFFFVLFITVISALAIRTSPPWKYHKYHFNKSLVSLIFRKGDSCLRSFAVADIKCTHQ